MNKLSEKCLCADNVSKCFFVLALSWSFFVFSLFLLMNWQKVQGPDLYQAVAAQSPFWRWTMSLGFIWAVVLLFLGIGVRNLAGTARALRRTRIDLLLQTRNGLRREAQFNALFASMPDAAVFADDQNRIIAVNSAFAELTGYSFEEVQGRTALFLFSQPGVVLNNEGEVRQAPCEMECRRKDDSIIPVETVCTRVRDAEGADMGFLLILRDVSEWKAAEKERAQLESRLRQAGRMETIGTLAGGIAHDFNNILGIIFINTDIALEEIPEESPARLNVRRIVSAAERARNLVKQILAYSRQPEQQQIALMPGSLLKESLKFLRATAPAGISVEEHIHDGFKSIMMDPAQLQELVMSLFSHALQALGERGIVEVNATVVELDGREGTGRNTIPAGHYFRISVSHVIPGSTWEERARNEVFSEDGTYTDEGALGLTTVRNIVRRQNGFISIEDRQGYGATVGVYFPLVALEMDPEEGDEQIEGSERVLLVDDEDMLLEMASMFLERHGFKVTARTDSREALAVFKSRPDLFDIVVTDQTMPEMTGSELAVELFKIRSDIPVILLSGYCKKISEDEVRNLGIRDFLYKPFDGKALARSIRKVMDEGC